MATAPAETLTLSESDPALNVQQPSTVFTHGLGHCARTNYDTGKKQALKLRRVWLNHALKPLVVTDTRWQ